MAAKKWWMVFCSVLVSVSMMGPAAATTALPAGASFDVGFSPNQGALDAVLLAIKSARREILVAAYSFTSKPVAIALLEAHRRGVAVKVVADEGENTKAYSAAQFLAHAGVPVRLNGEFYLMHHKFAVVDGMHVQLGSFNYSAAAVDKNAENVLVLWNVAPVASAYTKAWQVLWDHGKPVGAV